MDSARTTTCDPSPSYPTTPPDKKFTDVLKEGMSQNPPGRFRLSPESVS